jgi:hypothetical protein
MSKEQYYDKIKLKVTEILHGTRSDHANPTRLQKDIEELVHNAYEHGIRDGWHEAEKSIGMFDGKE